MQPRRDGRVRCSAWLGITVVINLCELINRGINISNQPGLVHCLFVLPQSSDTTLQCGAHLPRQIVAQLVARTVTPRRLWDNNLHSDVTVSLAASDPPNPLAAKLLKLTINRIRPSIDTCYSPTV